MVSNMFHGATFKVLGIALLALLMLIPLGEVNDLVGERQGRADEATRSIAERWGARQDVGAPVLVVPVRRQEMRERTYAAGTPPAKELVTVEDTAYVLADRASIAGTLTPEMRRYGIYETAVYTSDLKIEGRFAAADLKALAGDGLEAQWSRAELRVPIGDVRGIRRASTLHVGASEVPLAPTDGVASVQAVGARVPVAPDDLGDTLPFSLTLTLAGTERIAALPLAREMTLHLSGNWPHPGFDGAFLPASRRVDASGFEAEWQVLDLNRKIPARWLESEMPQAMSWSDFGLTLTQPAGAYQQNTRATKYGILFIALTFATFFMFEVLKKLRVHPVQYLLVGLALATFYLVLLALSETLGFGAAYGIASAAVVALVGGYASAILRARRAGVVLGALLALVYALLYGLVVSEDYALLMGSVALLAVLAAVMYLTRRVDWYALSPTTSH
jgi:inner membrane protein